MDALAAALLFLPLAGAALAMPCAARWGPRAGEMTACGGVILAAVIACVILARVIFGNYEGTTTFFPFIDAAGFRADWAMRIDSLSAVMFVVVAGISALVHVYSLGYMHDDPSRPRFFAYLSLFTFMMLALAGADNFLQLFFGWEGVGLASYLLIGFWHDRASANAAAIKAFVVNRIGDAGFLLGLAALFYFFGSLDYDVIFAQAPELAGKSHALPGGISVDPLTLIGLLLLLGAMGKSAQFLLHTWLPDAMEGPTPVSALIHAATMVTAGVFVIARAAPLYEHAPAALEAVAIVGAVTAVFAATVGLVQNDIKRVVAYSTCSQLGYMFAALGLGAYQAAIFHLFTHAFFKALLFLGAGSVIHAVAGEQDMRKMGGLARRLPYSWAAMLAGTLALTGFPLTAGYFSKDAIIEAAAVSGGSGQGVFWLLLTAAFFTAFYSWRLFLMTFHGKYRGDPAEGVHESPPVMLVPLGILAVGALAAGAAFQHLFIGGGQAGFWSGVFALRPDNTVLEDLHGATLWVVLAPAIASAAGFGLALWLCLLRPAAAAALARTHILIYRFLFHKWFFDEIYDALFVRPALAAGRLFWKQGDGGLIDGLGPDGLAARVRALTRAACNFQSGYLYHYAFAMLAGLTLLVTWLLVSGGR